ncbi:MAG: FtsW/RodA/SpoVE family cell cycle protein, partial [Anaerolineaceae bacterium]
MFTTREQWHHFDFPLFAAVLFLSIFGVALISSAIAGNPTLANHPQRQTVFLIIGLVLLFLFAGLDYKIWLVLTRPFYIVVAAFLILVFVTGAARFGAARWLQIGSEAIQPAELAKIVIIMALAQFFAGKISSINEWKTIGQSLLLTGGIVIWIILQPNLSTSIVIMVIWIAMLWISGWKT